MKINRNRIKCYALDRAQEAATWRGIVLLLTVAGWAVSPTMSELIVMVGLTLSGLIGALMPETMKRTRRGDGSFYDRRPQSVEDYER